MLLSFKMHWSMPTNGTNHSPQCKFIHDSLWNRKSSIQSFSYPKQELLMDCDNVLENSLNLITSFLISLLSFQAVFFPGSTNTSASNDNIKQQQHESNEHEEKIEEGNLFKLDELYSIYQQLQITHSERCIAIALLDVLSSSSTSRNDSDYDNESSNTSVNTITPSLIEDIHFVTNRACQRDAVIQFDSHCMEAMNEMVIGFFQSGVNYCLQQNHYMPSISSTSSVATPITPTPTTSRIPPSSMMTMKKKVTERSESGFDRISPISTNIDQNYLGRDSIKFGNDIGIFISISSFNYFDIILLFCNFIS